MKSAVDDGKGNLNIKIGQIKFTILAYTISKSN